MARRQELKASEAEENRYLASELLESQRPTMGVCSGIAASVAAATAWLFSSIVLGYTFYFVVVALGAAIGFTVGWVGQLAENRYGYVSSALTTVACSIGHYASARHLGVDLHEVYTGFGNALTIVFALGALVTAYNATFYWMSREQKDAIWRANVGLQ